MSGAWSLGGPSLIILGVEGVAQAGAGRGGRSAAAGAARLAARSACEAEEQVLISSCGPAALLAEDERIKLSSDLGSEDPFTACSAALVRDALQPVSATSHSEHNVLGH
jgi:hypothetical protein